MITAIKTTVQYTGYSWASFNLYLTDLYFSVRAPGTEFLHDGPLNCCVRFTINVYIL